MIFAKKPMLACLVWLCINPYTLHAQAKLADSCRCKADVAHLIGYMERNYVGYRFKVTSANSSHVASLKNSLLAKAASVQSPVACLELMRRWVGFFRDLHVEVYFKVMPPEKTRYVFSHAPSRKIGSASVLRYLNQNASRLDPVEGVWEMDDYRVGIIRNGKTKNFEAIVLQGDSLYWMPGQIKFSCTKMAGGIYRGTYYSLDHTPQPLEFRAGAGAALLTTNVGEWIRKYPKPSKTPQVRESANEQEPKVEFRQIDGKTTLLILPSFNYKAEAAIDSIIRQHHRSLLMCELLIIDIRGNGGGGVFAFPKLLPYIYTGPIVLKGSATLATDENIALFERQFEEADKLGEFDSTQRRELALAIAGMKKHRNKLHYEADSTIRLDSAFASPAKVAVLFNDSTLSAGELFLEYVESSRKVTFFGIPSGGAIDNLDNVFYGFSCYYELMYPVTRWGRYRDPSPPEKPIRIKPDVPVPPRTKDWVEWVQNYYRQQPGKQE